MSKYHYCGPVMLSDERIEQSWNGETWAESPDKAISELLLEFKKSRRKIPDAQFTLLRQYLYEC